MIYDTVHLTHESRGGDGLEDAKDIDSALWAWSDFWSACNPTLNPLTYAFSPQFLLAKMGKWYSKVLLKPARECSMCV